MLSGLKQQGVAQPNEVKLHLMYFLEVKHHKSISLNV